MIPRQRSFILTLVAALPLFALGQEGGLLGRSPFLPPGFGARPDAGNAQPQAEQPTDYEFRGFFAIGDDVRVLVKARNEQFGKWIRVDDASASPQILSFDAESKSLVMMQNGRETKLNLIQLSANSTPLPIAGLNTNAEAPSIEPNAQDTANRPTIRRRTVPPRRPQWLQDRLDQQNANNGNGLADGSTPEAIQVPTGPPPSPPENLPAEDQIPPPPSTIPVLPPGIGPPDIGPEGIPMPPP